MSIDLPAAVAFLATDGRVIDRRRLELLVHGGDPTAVLAALDGYHNLDGGYGWGREPSCGQRLRAGSALRPLYAAERSPGRVQGT